jgi:hypothetical protein
MKDGELMRKLIAEARLSEAELRDLDARLEAQDAVRHVVASLADDEPSLAWRSALNERLLGVAPRPKRRAPWRLLAPASGLAAAAIVATLAWLVVTGGPTRTAAPHDSLEAQLLQAHDHGAAMLDLSAGSAGPLVAQTGQDEGGFQWTEEDLKAL